jgi:hypothetical protein
MLSPAPGDVDIHRFGVDDLSVLNHMEVYTTDTTQARCWTLSKDQAQDEDLGKSNFAKKLSSIVSTCLTAPRDTPAGLTHRIRSRL